MVSESEQFPKLDQFRHTHPPKPRKRSKPAVGGLLHPYDNHFHLNLPSDSTTMTTSNSNGDSARRGEAFSAEHGIIQDIFEKMAQMELERPEKAQRMIQLEKEKLELTLRNITLERTVHALRRGSEIRKQDAIDGGDIPSDGHEN